MRWGWTVAAVVFAYMVGRATGERALMAEIKRQPPPDPPPDLELSGAELEQVIDLVPGPRGVYEAEGGQV